MITIGYKIYIAQENEEYIVESIEGDTVILINFKAKNKLKMKLETLNDIVMTTTIDLNGF